MSFNGLSRLFLTLAFIGAMETALADVPSGAAADASVAHSHVHKSTRASSGVTPFDIALFDFTPAATQPGLNFPIQSSDSCAGCHAPSGGTPPLAADTFMPYPTWSGSMMANATRDPVFWAALDVANHDVPGVGDFCLRCHATKGWTAGRVVKTSLFTPTNDVTLGAAGCLLQGDYDDKDTDKNDFSGVACHFCHRTEDEDPGQPIYGNGNVFLDDTNCDGGSGGHGGNEPCRHGPYAYGSFTPPHPAQPDLYTVRSDFCGNCHNVSSPGAPAIFGSGPLKTLLLNDGTDTGHAFPIERTFAEWQQSTWAQPDLIFRDELGDARSTPFALTEPFRSCQSCHMPISPDPSAVAAIFIGAPSRAGQLPVHEFAGGNAWVPQIIKGEFGAGLGVSRSSALDRTVSLAKGMLASSAKVELNIVSFTPPTPTSVGTMQVRAKIINLSGHKLPTGYGEGRRMWLNLKVNDLNTGAIVFESAAYDADSGVLAKDAQARVYETLQGIWNRNGTGQCDVSENGKEFFHFALSNCIAKDNRIPPLGFQPATRDDPNGFDLRPVGAMYPSIAAGSKLVNFDVVDYTVLLPAGSRRSLRVGATLFYQTSSKDYIEFLRDEAVNNGFIAENNLCAGNPSRPFTVGPQFFNRGNYLFNLWSLPHDPSAPTGAPNGYGKSPPVEIQSAAVFQF